MQRQSVQTFRSLVTTGPFQTLERNMLQYGTNHHGAVLKLVQPIHQQLTSMMIIRNMGGGPRNDEHKERLRALRKARKIYFESLPERPPKPAVCTKHYDEVIKWKTEPISKKIEHRVVHICSFIIYAWLNAYPAGASLRKLQRDIAFRMQRKHRIPGKLPYQVIMPIVGKLERENYLSIRMKSNGHVLIYRDKNVNITPEGQTHMEVGCNDKDGNEDGDDDETDDTIQEHFHISPQSNNEMDDTNVEMGEDPTMSSRPIPEDHVSYEKSNFRPKFVKEQKPKVKKNKKKKVRNRSDPVMEPLELPPDTIPTSRGPRFVVNPAATSVTVPPVESTTATASTVESQI